MANKLICNNIEAEIFLHDLFADSSGRCFSVALNAEKLIRMHKDAGFLSLIRAARAHVVDGVGAKLFLRRFYGIHASKVDFPSIALQYCNHNSTKVGVVGGAPQHACENRRILEQKYPNIDFEIVVDGYLKSNELSDLLISNNVEVCFLGLGTPLQEHEALRLSCLFPNTFFICCGGAIDVQVGRKTRAPNWIINGYFEWLYRLVKEPARIVRYIKLFRLLLILYVYKKDNLNLW